VDTQSSVSVDDGFGQIVRDIVHSLDDDDVRYEHVIQRIIDAYIPRIAGERRHAEDAERNAVAYAAMDRAQQEVLRYVRATIGQLAVANAAHIAHVTQLQRFRNEVRALMAEAETDETLTVGVGALQRLLDAEWEMRRTERPVPVGLAVDTRHTSGVFKDFEGVKAEVLMPFVGWTMVVNSRFDNSHLEPTFLRADGFTVTRTELAAMGLRFVRFL
jgi:hypothetical protein